MARCMGRTDKEDCAPLIPLLALLFHRSHSILIHVFLHLFSLSFVGEASTEVLAIFQVTGGTEIPSPGVSSSTGTL